MNENESNDEKEFKAKFDAEYDSFLNTFDKTLNIAVIGKVSAGKSSLINALLGCEKGNKVADVGSKSGITVNIHPYQLDERTLIVDCPGLNDVREENSKITQDFLDSIDVGIFVVTGSADINQKENFNDLRKTAKKTFVVLNKVDEWDDLDPSALNDVINQWKETLDVEEIYPVCTKGYDPLFRADIPLQLRGIDELSDSLFDFLKKEGKDILLAKNLKNKNIYAITVITTALLTVSGSAFIPGSAVYITLAQTMAISSLTYIYTGEILDKTSVLALLPRFVGQSIGTNVFLFIKSFLPPTGIVDVAASVVAVVITFAMLATVKWLYENNFTLNDSDKLKERYKYFYDMANNILTKEVIMDIVKNKDELKNILNKALK